MKIEEIEVRQFDKGMVDSIELGQSFNKNYEAPIVKYLENLTPNIIAGALCKRPNYTTFALYATANSQELPEVHDYSSANFVDYAGKRYVTGYFPHKYYKLPSPLDPEERVYYHMLTGEVIEQANYLYGHLASLKSARSLVGMDRFDMRNPVAGNVYMALFRDDLIIDNQVYQTTSVNGFYYSKSLDVLASSGYGWLNPLYDSEYLEYTIDGDVGVPFRYKGKQVNGIVLDWVVIGQAVYLVSVPGKIHESLPASPAYRWAPIPANDLLKLSTVFSQSTAKRTYYLISADTSIDVKATTLLIPYGNGLYKNHPQYRGNSDLSFTANSVAMSEHIDFDGIKDSIDIVWWQTNRLPVMDGITTETIQDVLVSTKPTGSRLAEMNAEWHEVKTVGNGWGGAYITAGVNNTLVRVPTATPLTAGGVQSPAVYYETLFPEMDNFRIEEVGEATKRDAFLGDLAVYDTCPYPTNGINAGYQGHLGEADAGHYPSYGAMPGNLSTLINQCAMRHRLKIGDSTYENGQINLIWRAMFSSTQSVPLEYWFSVKKAGIVKYHKIVPYYFRHTTADDGQVLFVNNGTVVRMTTGNGSLTTTLLYRMSHDYGDDWLTSIWLSKNKEIEPNAKKILNYAKINAPRLWSPGEEIPYIVTVTVDGVEYIVKQDTYTVGYGNSLASITIAPSQQSYFAYSDIPAFGGTQWPMEIEQTVVPETDAQTLSNQFPFVCFTLRFNIPQNEDIYKYMPRGLSRFKLYVAMPNPSTASFFSTDESEWAVDIYRKSLVQDSTSRAYALVKEFLLQEDRQLQEDGSTTDFANFNRGQQGTMAVAHGKWTKYPNPEPTINQGTGSPQLTYNGGSGFYYIPYTGSTFNLAPTPDFYLWDYAEGPALSDSLGQLTVSWDGVGARCITQVSNRVVIGGTIDKDGSEEVGRIRAAAVQGTTMLNTVFAELDALDLCSTPIEALANFRNDLWVFSRDSIVRVTPSNPYTMSTWQIADTINGQGILNRKHLIQVPDGIYFANATGLWFVNGSQIENIALPVLQTYRFMYNPAFSDWQGYNKYNIVPISGTFNPSLELSYDAFRNEIVLSVASYRYANNLADMPVQENVDLQLRFNLSTKAFHLEAIDLPPGRHHYQSYAHSEYGRVRFNDHDTKLVIPLLYDRSLTWLKGGNGFYDTVDMGYTYDRIEAQARFDNTRYFDQRFAVVNRWYAGYVTLHELGNGMDDCLLRQAIVEVSPIEHVNTSVIAGGNAASYAWRDPKLLIQYRNRENRNWASAPELPAVPFPVDAGIYDLVELNSRLVAPTEIFWSDLNRPVSRAFARESIVLNTPLNAKFRRFEATFITTSLTYLKGFKFKFAKYLCKTFG